MDGVRTLLAGMMGACLFASTAPGQGALADTERAANLGKRFRD